MSRRTQLTTKFVFQILAQLSENFIFIYLGLTLFTETKLEYNPMLILITLVGICGARWLSVFPLSKAINYVIRVRARRRGRGETADELPWHYQAMLYWAGLRGAVGVALAAGLQGPNGSSLRATVLVVVVLTVIIFGGTTARMLEILGIRTGVVEEIDSDDEFDIETANGGTYYKRSGSAFGHNPKPSINLDHIPNDDRAAVNRANGSARPSRPDRGYSSSNRHSPPIRPGNGPTTKQRTNSTISARDRERDEQAGHLLSSGLPSDDDSDDGIDLDLPPAAPRRKSPSPMPPRNVDSSRNAPSASDHDIEHDAGDMGAATSSGGVTGGIRDLLRGAVGAADHTAWLRQLDEDFIKPKLLLDQGQGRGGDHGGGPA
jgi:solute carrier family 9 (sodium/hydrogen exchanger), member 6/7